MRAPAVPKWMRLQFLRVARYERATELSPYTGVNYIWNGNYILQQYCQWILFPDREF